MREQATFSGWDFTAVWSIDESSSYPWLRTNEQSPHPGAQPAAQNNPPSKSELVFPANGQTGLGSTVTFKWRPATDPNGDTISYDIYYCLDPAPLTHCSARQVASFDKARNTFYAGFGYAGLGLILAGVILGTRPRKMMLLLLAAMAITGIFVISCGNKESNDEGLLTYKATDINAAKTYYWAIVAKDDKGEATASDVWSFVSE